MTASEPPTEPVVEIRRREAFSASHVLTSPHLSVEENRRLYGPCNNLHGHNYELEVTVRGPVDTRTGMVMNLTELMRIVREKVIAEVDHKHLNGDVPFLEGVIPTAENLAVAFWDRLQGDLNEIEGCRLHQIRLFESRENYVDYFGPGTSTPS